MRQALVRTLVPALAFVANAALLTGSAHAASGPCVVGDPSSPRCAVWTGKVTFVDDGDTIDVDVAGDGTRTPVRVRVTGIQAMEQTVYSSIARRRRGECHALDATSRLEALIRRARWRVRLAAMDPASQSRARRRRSVAVRLGGRWRDVGRVLVAEGRTLWLPNQVEWAWNAEYAALADAAAAAGRRIWDTDFCGRGPSASARLALELNWDAEGDDRENLNGEYVEIRNDGPTGVPLDGWWLRDSDLRRYRFPADAVVPAGGSVTLEVGPGPNGGGVFHWGLDEPAFENVDPSRGIGDGAYLFDPQGDLRAWSVYH